MTRRVRMIIQYDGTAYAGWQRQLTGLGIQQVMEEELAKLTGHKCALHASGRTDSGVHAAAQVAHFDTDCLDTPSFSASSSCDHPCFFLSINIFSDNSMLFLPP